ncbi:MAG: isoprenylcysteine carboxylmethyltransferase family protein [Marinoscillum sp.]
MDYLVVIICWVIYLGLHSLLANQNVKDVVRRKVKWLWSVYRIFYSTVSTVGLVLMCYQIATTPSLELFESPGYLRYMAMILASWGVILTMVSFRHLSGLEFLGLKKSKQTGLVREGLHGYVRHPIYSGNILVILGLFLFHPTDIILISVVIIMLYLPIGIHFEEQKLMAEFGEEYEAYKEQVPAIFPKLRL